jgi:tetratricopeptide (TPR) repeat protein
VEEDCTFCVDVRLACCCHVEYYTLVTYGVEHNSLSNLSISSLTISFQQRLGVIHSLGFFDEAIKSNIYLYYCISTMAISKGFSFTMRNTRKNSFNGLRVGLDMGHLVRFLKFTIAAYSTDDHDLVLTASMEAASLAESLRQSSLDDSRDELINCITVISAFLQSAPLLPTAVVFEAHSLIGCIEGAIHRHRLSCTSFLKALWLAASSRRTDGISAEQLALTLHRLGNSHSEVGDSKEAKSLLRKALDKYAEANVRKDHPAVVDAQDHLDCYNRKRQSYLQYQKGWKSCSIKIERPALSLIKEDSSAERRMSC